MKFFSSDCWASLIICFLHPFCFLWDLEAICLNPSRLGSLVLSFFFFFVYNFFKKIEVQLIYSVSGVQQSDSVVYVYLCLCVCIYIYIYIILFLILGRYKNGLRLFICFSLCQGKTTETHLMTLCTCSVHFAIILSTLFLLILLVIFNKA